MPVISADTIQAQIYRVSYIIGKDQIENVIVTPDGLYNIQYIKNGRIEGHNGKILKVVNNAVKPKDSYILLDYSCDHNSRRERIYFYQVQLIQDITPNDAYRIACKHGFKGSVEEWLESLKGPRGYSVYELACQAGFTGTLEEYLESLKGEPGKSAYELAVDAGYNGTLEEFLNCNGNTALLSQRVDRITSQLQWVNNM